MRRPPQDNFHRNNDESRLARVKRVLADSLSLGRGGGAGTTNSGNSNKIFGARLEQVESYLDTGVPYVVHRLCGYIKKHGFQNATLFRLSGGSPRLTERLRNAFEKKGDADLEGSSCPSTAATLLRQYLIELPQPLVPSTLVAKLLRVHIEEYSNRHDEWIEQTHQLLQSLPPSHYRLFGYLANYLTEYETKHGPSSGVCGVFAPVVLPHVPPATTLLRDILANASKIFPDCDRNSAAYPVTTILNDCKICQKNIFCPLKPRKRKERRESCCQERKLIRSNSEEQILDIEPNKSESIRRVSSHEDFVVQPLSQDMGYGVTCAGLPALSSPTHHDTLISAERLECDFERVRSTERFSRSITPRGRRQTRRRNIYKGIEVDTNTIKENKEEASSNNHDEQSKPSFLEMLSSGPSRSPSPVRPIHWGINERVEAMLSPRNSILVPRRFYTENNDPPNITNSTDHGLKTITKHINGLKKKIKKYEDEFEENFGYRPSHSDKMSNRDIKRLCAELNKLRKEHKLLKEDPISALKATVINKTSNTLVVATNNNNSPEKTKAVLVEEMVKDVDRRLSEKRIKCNRSDNMDDMSYEQLLDEKTAVQKALLHIEEAFGRPVSKEDRSIVRPLYDRYRTLKRLLIRTGPNKNKDSISELATILEHEAMDFTSSSLPNYGVDSDRRASEPDMSHRGILDCIDAPDQLPTDSDSQHSSSEGSRGTGDCNLHAISHEELIVQQKHMREDKKRLRRALKELEAQFEARAGRKMQREDRGPHVTAVYESYKQTKAKLRLIEALLAKNNA